jgi:MFS transporter, UMF1 family
VATTFVFNTYLSSSAFGDPARESELLGAFTAVAGIVIAIVAPVAGQRTDASGHRKRWLAINSGVVALCFWHSISRLGVLGAQAGRVPAR